MAAWTLLKYTALSCLNFVRDWGLAPTLMVKQGNADLTQAVSEPAYILKAHGQRHNQECHSLFETRCIASLCQLGSMQQLPTQLVDTSQCDAYSKRQ
jgi:hypothetical protein